MAEFASVGGSGSGGGTGFFVPDASPFATIQERDTWATANADELVRNGTIVNVTGDGWYLWNGLQWIGADPIVQGEPGSAANLADVNVGHVPMKRPDGSFGDSGVEILDSGTVLIPSNTLGIGDLIELSEGTGFGLIHNNESNLSYLLLDALLSDTTGSNRPRQFVVQPTSLVEFESGGTDTLTDNPLVFDRTISADGSTFTLEFTTAQAMTNTKMRLVDDASGVVIKYIPTKLAWENTNRPGYDLRLGINTVNFFSNEPNDPANGVFNLGYSPLIFLGGRVLRVEIQADNMALIGDSTVNMPNFSGLFGAGAFREIAYLDEIPTDNGGGGGTNPPADAETIYYGLINSADASTFDIATVTTETDVRNPHTVTTGEVTTNRYFVILVPTEHELTSITDTVLNQDVTSVFTKTSNVRTIAGAEYTSYVVGELTQDLNEQYVIRF